MNYLVSQIGKAGVWAMAAAADSAQRPKDNNFLISFCCFSLGYMIK